MNADLTLDNLRKDAEQQAADLAQTAKNAGPGAIPEEPGWLADAPQPGKGKGRPKGKLFHELYSIDSEKALVSAALNYPHLFDLVQDLTHFHDELLREVYQVGRDLLHDGRIPDRVTLGDALRRRGLVNAETLLLDLVGRGEGEALAETYAKTLAELATRRQGVTLMEMAAGKLFDDKADVGTVLTNLATQVGKLAAKSTTVAKRAERKTSWTLAELYDADFPEPPYAVPGLVPMGLSFLAGRPKVGKSWLALQFAHAAGSGGMVLNQRVERGKVLYLALEDFPRRLKDRCQKQKAPRDASIRFETSWRRATEGGLDDLREYLAAERPALVIIDTISRFLSGSDQKDNAQMYQVCGDLQGFALEFECAILLVDHHVKPQGENKDAIPDPVDAIYGDTAKAAVADAVMGLTKQQGRPGAILSVRGRDIEEKQLGLSWDHALFCWQYEGTAEEVALKGHKRDVLMVLRNQHPNRVDTKQILPLCGMTENNLSPILAALRAERLIDEERNGRTKSYALTPTGCTAMGVKVQKDQEA